MKLSKSNFTKINSSTLFYIFLILYFFSGNIASLYTGITADEFIEQRNWNLKLELIKSLFDGNNAEYFNLLKPEEYLDRNIPIIDYDLRFYGVGFHYFSQIYLYIAGLFIEIGNLNSATTKVLLNHCFTFSNFFLSALFAGKILQLIIKDKLFTNLFIIFYLLYPYLLGHGFYNPKDTPFLFAWILSTYISLNLALKAKDNKNITNINIFILALSTAYLFSVRISGVLILIQYLISFLLLQSSLKKNFYDIFKLYFFKIILFTIFTTLITILFYPLFWKNPLLIVDAINQMRNYPFGVCTLTLGKCMESVDLPSSYIFIWLFFKLPIIFFIALVIFPFIEERIFSNISNQIILGSILLSVLLIIFLLVFFNVNLHGELRHLLFIVSLILILSYSIIYFYSKKLLKYTTVILIFFFTVQNLNMYPYQYTWFNLFGHFVNINNNFDLDYWGVSGRNLAKEINNNEKLLKIKNKCIYSAPTHLIKPFISNDYKCIKHLTSIYPKSSEQYILVKYTREISRDHPSECKLIIKEGYKYNLYGEFLKMGEIYICN